MKKKKEGHDVLFLISDILDFYKRYWYLVLASLAVIVGVCCLYLYQTAPVYELQMKVQMDNDPSVSDFENDLNLIGTSASRLATSKNEIEDNAVFLKTAALMQKVVDKLNLNTYYYRLSGVKQREIYGKEVPFYMKGIGNYETSTLDVSIIGFHTIRISGEKGSAPFSTSLKIDSSAYFILPIGEIYFKWKDALDETAQYENLRAQGDLHYRVNFENVDQRAVALSNQLQVSQSFKNSNVLTIAYKTKNTQRGRDLLETLVECFNEEKKAYINKSYVNSNEFIDSRLVGMNADLVKKEEEIKDFQRDNMYVGQDSKVSYHTEKLNYLNKKRLDIQTQLDNVNSFYDFITKDAKQLIVFPMKIDDSYLSGQIKTHNELMIQYNKIAKSSTEDNPVLIDIGERIDVIRDNILSNLDSQKESLVKNKLMLDEQYRKIESSFRDIPDQTRKEMELNRLAKIQEELYLLLVKRKEENNLAMSLNRTPAIILERPIIPTSPVYPRKSLFLFASFVLGLTIPYGVYLCYKFTKIKISTKLDITDFSDNLNVIGEMTKEKTKNFTLSTLNQNSRTSLCFNSLRTSLHMLLRNGEKVISVTSTTSGEGKSFISINLALSMALLKKKVVVVGLDLHDPQLGRFLAQREGLSAGASMYLSSNEMTIDDVLQPFPGNDYLSVLPAGPIPPNPNELLSDERLIDMFDELRRRFDFIIIDTAPVGLVSDTFLIDKVSDVTLYIVRADFSMKKDLVFVENIQQRGDLHNIYIVLNDVSYKNSHNYYYGHYGKYAHYKYHYGEKQKRA